MTVQVFCDFETDVVDVLHFLLRDEVLVDLLKGNYTVTVQGDNGEAPQTLNVTVLAQQVETTTAMFDSMSADQYFERSGW